MICRLIFKQGILFVKTRIALKTHTEAVRKTEDTFKQKHFMNDTVETMKFF